MTFKFSKCHRLFQALFCVLLLSGCGAKTPDEMIEKLAEEEASESTTTTTTTTTTLPDTTAPETITLINPATNPYHFSGSQLLLGGSCEPTAQVELSGDDSQATVCSELGAFSFAVSKTSDASYTFQIKQTDAAGNSSSPVSLIWVRNSFVPAPVLNFPTHSPYESKTDSLTLTGTCLNGNQIRLSGDSTQKVSCESSSFSLTVSQVIDGQKTYNLIQEDANGATSASVSLIWRRDTVAPAAPTLQSPISSPYTSSENQLHLLGECEAGANVQISGDATSSKICQESQFDFSLSQTSDGTYSYSLLQTDAAGNLSALTNFLWIRDTALPLPPVLSSPSISPFPSNQSSLTLSGSCQTGFTVLLSGSSIQTATCVASGFSFTDSQSTDGTYSYSLSQRNPATMLSSSPVSMTWVRDTQAPLAPTLLSPVSSPFHSSGNLSLTGQCESGAQVFLTGDRELNTPCLESAFQFQVTADQDATYQFQIHQKDEAQNTSGSLAFTWVRDSVIPASPTLSAPASSPYLSNSTQLTLSGGCINGMKVVLGGDLSADEILEPAGKWNQICANSSFLFSVQKTTDGIFQLNLKQSSLAGLESSATHLQWILDRLAPETNLSQTPTNPNFGNSATFAFASTETGSFECQVDGAAFTSCSSPLTLSGLSLGSHSVSVRARDEAGNSDLTPANFNWSQSAAKTVALYHLDSANPNLDSGGFAAPNNNPLTNNGTTNNSQGAFSQARSFNGSTQFLSAAPSASLAQTLTRMTVEAFVKTPTLTTSNSVILARMGAKNQMGWEFGIKKLGVNYRLYFEGSLNGTSVTKVDSANLTTSQKTALQTGYTHVAFTWDQGTVKIYFAGQLIGSAVLGSGAVSLFDNSNTPLTIGATNGQRFLSGSIDEIRISQVLRWTSNFTPPSSAYSAD
ncbi:MAG: LamG-like jellyroll fold domain-containing protein [Pseudobdellovibrionaceae bacterium]